MLAALVVFMPLVRMLLLKRAALVKKEEIVKNKAVEYRLLRLRLVTLCPGESVTTFFYIVLTCVFHYICEV